LQLPGELYRHWIINATVRGVIDLNVSIGEENIML
jgi:hypothetical protein